MFPLYAVIDGQCGCGDPKCGAAGKHPNPYKAEQPGAGHGVETGGGLLVLDIDVKKANGYDSLQGKEVPDTYAVRTPTGGAHLYYSYDPAVASCRCRVAVLPGVDIRADGGFVVGAGSPHANGGVYDRANQLEVAPAPAWLVDLARKPVVDVEVPTPLDPADPTFELNIRRCSDELRTFPPAVQGSGGDTQLFLAAQIPVRKYQLPLDVAERLLVEVYNPRCEPPWEDTKRITHKVQEAATKGSRAVGTADWLQKLISREPPAPLLRAKDPDHVYTYDPGTPALPQRVPLCISDVLNKLLTDPVWSTVWRYDEFRDRVVAVDPPMRLDAETRGFTENDATLVACWFESQGFKVSTDQAFKSCMMAANRNRFHPVREYLDSLPAPSTGHLDGLALEIYGDASPWAQRFLRNTLVGAVRRILRPGCAFDYIPVLYGPDQGEGKSKSIRALFGEEFSSEQFPDLGDMVRACMDIQGLWAVEAAELHTIRSHAAQEAAKAFISRQVDCFTPKYGRIPIRLERQCVFIGTTNEDEFLRDKTGNRRYWPIRVTKTVDREWIRVHRDEIWSEAHALAKTDYRAYFTREEDAQIDDEVREAFEETDSWHEKIRGFCVGRAFVTVNDVYYGVINTDAHATVQYDKAKQFRIASVLKQLGCKHVRKWQDGKNAHLWSVPNDVARADVPVEEASRRALDEMKNRAN